MSADFLRKGAGSAAQAPADTTRRVRSAMRCDKRPRYLTAKTSADFLRKGTAAMQRRPPAGTTRRVRSAMCRDVLVPPLPEQG